MKNKQKMLWIYLGIIILIGLPLMYFMGQSTQKKVDTIIRQGIHTEGTVIRRLKGAGGRNMFPLGIKYDFQIGDKYYTGYQPVSSDDFYDIIVGMKYQVRYLPGEKPSLNSFMLVREPIDSAYKGIPQERERIEKTYDFKKSAINTPPLDEIPYFQLMKD